MYRCRLMLGFFLLGCAALPAWAVEAWMPERPSFRGVDWDVATAPPGGCEVVDLAQHSLLSRLSALAGLRMPALYLCAGRGVEASTLPPYGIAVTGELASLPLCQKAFVLGHELAHLAMRHAEETAAALRSVARLPTASAVDAFAVADFDMSLLLHLSPLLRAQEIEADRLGALLAAGLGCPLEQSGLAYLKRLPLQGARAVVETHDGPAERARKLQPLAASATAIVEHRALDRTGRALISGGGF